MHVAKLYTDWEEKNKRDLRVCTPEEAVQLLNDPGFIQAMQSALDPLHPGK